MCLGIPGRLVEIISQDFQVGTVEVSGMRRPVSLAVLTPSAPWPGSPEWASRWTEAKHRRSFCQKALRPRRRNSLRVTGPP
jgi:hypothetical protein